MPVRLRVTAVFALAMALVLAGTGLFLYVRLDSRLAAALDRDLRLRGQDLSVVVRQPGSSLATATSASLVERGESYAQLLDRRGRVLDATRPSSEAPLLTPAQVARARRGTIFVNLGAIPTLDEPSRVLATPVDRPGEQLVLVVGVTRQDKAETLAGLRNELFVVGPLALLLASVVGYVLAGLGLRPVESMRQRAAAISADQPGERLPVPATGDEIQRLAETLNAMLGRLETALARERDFVADAGHELRTPLALLRTELELALRHAGSPAELSDAVRHCIAEVDRLAQLAEALLLIAHSERGDLPLQRENIEARDLAVSVVNRFAWRAEEAGRSLTTSVPLGTQLSGDRLRLEQALGNLVDNALRHGAGDVLLSARSVDDVVELHVVDTGLGFPPEFLGRAFDRFARSPRARAGSGSGLGLAIVQVIAKAHGGSAGAGNHLEGGADVWIALPGVG
ncbi:MAG: ATP-binding protein [Gaiellaceae bacterium]